jgi:hypothetical protein
MISESRRTLLLQTVGAAFAAAFPPVLMGSVAAEISPAVRRVYDSGLVIDATGSPEDFIGGCRALHDNPRNKDDDTLRAMANKGGVIGIYFMPFLGDNGSPWATEAMVLDHIDHALKACTGAATRTG